MVLGQVFIASNRRVSTQIVEIRNQLGIWDLDRKVADPAGLAHLQPKRRGIEACTTALSLKRLHSPSLELSRIHGGSQGVFELMLPGHLRSGLSYGSSVGRVLNLKVTFRLGVISSRAKWLNAEP